MPTEGMPSVASKATPATFELERFAWSAPDRLELSGRFAGLGEAPEDAPVLVVRGPDRTQTLDAVPGSVSGSPADGERWYAEFAWQEAPSAFRDAELRLGALSVGLPDPRGRRTLFGRHTLEVRRTDAQPGEAGPEAAPEEGAGRQDAAPEAATDLARLQADLLVAQRRRAELRTQLQDARDELATLRAELDAERDRHAAAAERFRTDLAAVSASAEQAADAEREAAQRVSQQLSEARSALERAKSDLAEAAEARAEVEDLRALVAELEPLAREAAALRARNEELERELAEAGARETEHEGVRTALADARAGLEALLARLPAAAGGDAPGGRAPAEGRRRNREGSRGG